MKIFRKILLFLTVVILIVLTYLGFNGYLLYEESMKEKDLDVRIAELKSIEHFTHYNELPQYYIDAVISIEDHRFFSHSGVDYIATARAVLNDIKAMEVKEGGSSITQQVAKNLCFTQEKTLYRKIAELFVVHQLENRFSKEEIFELYINNMYFGSGYYTIYDASIGYYNKFPKDLSVYEATLLAGVPNAPSVYDPRKNLNLAEERQSQVLDAMVEFSDFSKNDADNIKQMQKTKH